MELNLRLLIYGSGDGGDEFAGEPGGFVGAKGEMKFSGQHTSLREIFDMEFKATMFVVWNIEKMKEFYTFLLRLTIESDIRTNIVFPRGIAVQTEDFWVQFTGSY